MALIKILTVGMTIKNIPANITKNNERKTLTVKKKLLKRFLGSPFRPDLTGGMNQSEASTSSIKWIAMATVH